MELSEGAVIADRFRLTRQLGKGGMGEVWLAQHTSLDIPCAVKFIHAESASDEIVRSRFEREAKAAAQLRSNNVVQILDYGVFEETPYIAMEYLDGEPLNARLRRRGRLDAHETFRIVGQVGRALTKAHAAGIIHRDLKPENVFLVADEEGEIAKVLDFGVAKRTEGIAATDSATKTGALLGTPFYMSPEQAQGTKTVDARADLWSLAVLTYRCITGQLPFRSEALGDLLIKIVTYPVPVPSEAAAGIPDGFDQWWQRAAQRDPDARFQTAKELVEALGLAVGVTVPNNLDGQTPMPTANGPQLPLATVAGAQTPGTSPGPGWLNQAQGATGPATGPVPTGTAPGIGVPNGPAAAPSSSSSPGQPGPLGDSSPDFQPSGGPHDPSQSAPDFQSPVGPDGSLPQPHPPQPTALLPAYSEGQQLPPNTPLGESMATVSVGGVFTPAEKPRSSKKGAMIGIAIGGLLVGCFAAILAFRGSGGEDTGPANPAPTDTAVAAAGDTSTSEQAPPGADTATAGQTSDTATAGTASANADAEDQADAGADTADTATATSKTKVPRRPRVVRPRVTAKTADPKTTAAPDPTEKSGF